MAEPLEEPRRRERQVVAHQMAFIHLPLKTDVVDHYGIPRLPATASSLGEATEEEVFSSGKLVAR